jgi:hypothetical protein
VKAWEDKWIADDPVPTRGELRAIENLQTRGNVGKALAWFGLALIAALIVGVVVNVVR